MRNFIIAALLAVASIATISDNAQAASGNYVWHHGTPIFVGSGSARTHGWTVSPRRARVLRAWYTSGTRRSR